MARIEKLSICGIRSFSPTRDEVIEFYSPLTMIVGANGCGKTTVIECLRYACTGILPPNSRNGQTFVHDPKMEGLSEVKACIKLRFRPKDDQKPIVVIRSLQLSQKKTTVQFKALDGVLKCTDENGITNSSSLKCGDLDRQLPVLLGVSRSILESVIFCHQEESSWPLQEGSVLKKKFDDIFESARYTKALDVIKTTRQDLTAKVKDLRIELAGLQANLSAATELQADYSAAEVKSNATNEQLNDLNDKITAVQADLQQCQIKAAEVEKLRYDLESATVSVREIDAQINEKQSHMTKTFDAADDDQLKHMLQEFNDKVDSDNKQKSKLLQEQRDESETLSHLHATRDSLYSESGKISSKLEEQEQLTDQRDKMSISLARSYSIELIPGNVSAFVQSLEQRLRDLENNASTLRNEHRNREDNLTNSISRTQADQRSMDLLKKAKTKEIKQVESEIQAIRLSINQQSREEQSAKHDLEEQKLRANAAKNEYDHHCKTKKDGDIKKLMTDLEKQLSAVGVDLAQEREALRCAQSTADEQRELTIKLKSIEQDRIKLLNDVNACATLQVLGYNLTANDHESLSNAAKEVQRRKNDGMKELQELRQKTTQLTSSQTELNVFLKQAQQKVQRFEAEKSKLEAHDGPIQQSKDTIKEISTEYMTLSPLDDDDDDNDTESSANKMLSTPLDQDNLPAAIEFLKKDLKDIQDVSTIVDGRIKAYGSLRTKSVNDKTKKKKANQSCPCCKREMNAADLKHFNSFIDKQTGDKALLELGELNKRGEKCQAFMTKIEKLQSHWSRYQDISQDLSKAKDELITVQSNVRNAETKLMDMKEKVDESELKLREIDVANTEVQALLTEINRIEANARDADNKKARVGLYSESLDDTRNIDEIQAAYDEGIKHKDDLTTQYNDARSKLQQSTATMLNLSTRKNETEKEYLRSLAIFDKAQSMRNEFDMLEKKRFALQTEVQEFQCKEAPKRQELNDLEASLRSERDQFREKFDTLQKKIQTMRSDTERLTRLVKAVNALIKENWQKQKQDQEQQVISTCTLISDMEKQQNQRLQQIRILEQSASNQIAERKSVEDNISLRALVKHKDQLIDTKSRLQDKLTKEGGNEINRQINDYIQELNAHKEARAELKGKLGGLQEQMKGISDRLKTSAYKGIQERQRKTLIDVETTHMAANDLDKYWTALDKALMRYHKEKIMEINKFIRELWQITYKGCDIDNIEIVSGEEGASTKATRSYNYRVAMRKGSATLDMKGRCSAGQRVLASIVIRLALAETFCVNCGILALDEPTTNLDLENKDGLAKALSRIIATRSTQSNFQLIVITHDKDFVDSMKAQLGASAGFNMPEKYMLISREQAQNQGAAGQYYSKITKLDL